MPRSTPRLVVRTALSLVLIAGSAAPLALAQGAPAGGERRTQPDGERRQRAEGEGGGRRGGGMGMFGGGGMRGMFDGGVTSRQIESMKTSLKLSEDQNEAVEALFEAYQDSSTKLTTDMREQMDKAREDMREAMQDGGGPDADAMKKMGEQMDKARKARKDLEASFFTDVKAVLTAEQTQKWPNIELAHRREATIGRGLMSGERVDVIRLVEDLKLPEKDREALETVLGQYAADLDRELTARNEFQEKAMTQGRELFQSGDDTKIQKLFDDGRALSTRVRDVNRRYSRQIEGMLPEASREKFVSAFQRESFPQVYRPTYGTRSLESAAKLADLDAEQKTSIAAIGETYKRDLAVINKEMEAATEKREASFSPADMMGGRGRGGGGGGFFGGNDEASQELRDRRRALDDSTLQKIKGVLKPEQFEQLPARDERGGRGGGDGAGGAGGAGGDEPAPRRNRRNNNDAPNRDIPKPTPGPTR